MAWGENSRRLFLKRLGAAGTLALAAANTEALASSAARSQAQDAAGIPRMPPAPMPPA